MVSARAMRSVIASDRLFMDRPSRWSVERMRAAASSTGVDSVAEPMKPSGLAPELMTSSRYRSWRLWQR